MRVISMEDKKNIEILYEFCLSDGKTYSFPIILEAETLLLVNDVPKPYPDWIKLDFCKCSVCPLDSAQNDICPLAANLMEIVESFHNIASVEITEIKVTTPERTISQRLPIQKGLSSMLGIYMSTSACPVMKILRPMVRYHLPFASVEETIFRSVSAYLMGQYFVMKEGKSPDWNLEKLTETYAEIEDVNTNMTKRIRPVIQDDASINAIVILDVFAKFVPLSIETSLEKLKYLYSDIC